MAVLRTGSSALQQHLGEDLDHLARDCGVILRERAFSGRSLRLMIVAPLLHKPDATWADVHLTAAHLGLEVTRPAGETRFAAGQPRVEFFRSALETALRQSVAADPAARGLLPQFTAVLVGAASTIALPDELADLFPGCGGSVGASRAALNLQGLWDLKTGHLAHLHVAPGRGSDAKSPLAYDEAAPGSLLVYDLGYFDRSRFASLDATGATALSRLQHGPEAYDGDGNPLTLVAFLRRPPTGLGDREVLPGVADRRRCRLVAIRVPAEVANRRRQQAYEKAAKKGRTPTAAYLELLGWSLFVTNAKAEELTWKAVVVLYRARWQMELLLTLWKSHNRLARHRPQATALAVLAAFYAKLLGVLLQHWVLAATAWSCAKRRRLKAVRVLGEMVKEILLGLGGSAAVEAALGRLRDLIENRGGTTDRTKDPSHAQLLDDPDLLDWLC